VSLVRPVPRVTKAVRVSLVLRDLRAKQVLQARRVSRDPRVSPAPSDPLVHKGNKEVRELRVLLVLKERLVQPDLRATRDLRVSLERSVLRVRKANKDRPESLAPPGQPVHRVIRAPQVSRVRPAPLGPRVIRVLPE